MDREISGILHEKVLEDGRTLCLLLDYDGNVILTSWKEKPEKKRTGHKTRYCIGERFDELTRGQRDAVLSLRGSILNNGKMKSRRKTKFGRRSELVEKVGPSMLNNLISSGVVFELDGCYYLNREFLFRG